MIREGEILIVGASLPVRCPEIRNVRYSGIFITLDYSEFRQDTKSRPLFGRSPLLGVSAKREFTVYTLLLHTECLSLRSIVKVFYCLQFTPGEDTFSGKIM